MLRRREKVDNVEQQCEVIHIKVECRSIDCQCFAEPKTTQASEMQMFRPISVVNKYKGIMEADLVHRDIVRGSWVWCGETSKAHFWFRSGCFKNSPQSPCVCNPQLGKPTAKEDVSMTWDSSSHQIILVPDRRYHLEIPVRGRVCSRIVEI